MHNQFVTFAQKLHHRRQFRTIIAGRAGYSFRADDLTACLRQLGFLDIEVLA